MMNDPRLCANCRSEVSGKYCSHCGQDCRKKLPDLVTFLRESFSDYFDVDSRILRSLRELFFSPGTMTANYLDGKRQRYLPPFNLFFAVSLTFLFTLSHTPGLLIHIDWYGVSITTLPVRDVQFTSGEYLPKFLRSIVAALGEKATTTRDFRIFEHVGGAILCLVPLFSFLLKFFYPSRRIIEHLVFSLHLYSGCLVILFPGIIPISSVRFHDAFNFLLNGVVLWFLYRMLRKVYTGSSLRTLGFLIVFVGFHIFGMIMITVVIARTFLI